MKIKLTNYYTHTFLVSNYFTISSIPENPSLTVLCIIDSFSTDFIIYNFIYISNVIFSLYRSKNKLFDDIHSMLQQRPDSPLQSCPFA